MTPRRILGYTGWNLAGLGLPVLVAIVTMPMLIHALGGERFGLLALAWLITGYFALFDFGVGRATTRLMSAARGAGREEDRAAIYWNSVYIHTAFGLSGGLIFAGLAPALVRFAFTAPGISSAEAQSVLLWLSFSVPALVVASAMRGALEADHRFDLVNAVKMPASTLNYLAPLVTLLFTDRIDHVVAVIAVSRWLVTAAYAILCSRTVRLPSGSRRPDRATVFRLLGDGGWLTVTSLVTPLIMVLDRFLIARFGSLEAVTYYVVPYEAATKLWILSASVLGAVFPLMSARQGDELRDISSQALRWLLTGATPPVLVAILFAHQILALWVGGDIAVQSAPVLQILAAGVWLNVLAQVPLTTLQAAGRADVVGKLHLVELPLYALLVAWLVIHFGVTGAAAAWAMRALANAVALRTLLVYTLDGFGGWPWKRLDG